MRYEKTVSFNGDADQAFEVAVAPLTSLGFRLTQRSPTAIEFEGPGMKSSRESALMGATQIRVTARSRELALEAELGGVEFMSRFVRYFPLGLALVLFVGLGIAFAVAFGGRLGMTWMWPLAAAAGGNVVLWLFLGPILASKFRNRTCAALDALLGNMAAWTKR
jgi:hypothetical protein